MRSEWRVNKDVCVPYAGNVVFMTLYEDVRDVMCDSVRPEWEISQRTNNRRIVWNGLDGRVVRVCEIDRDTGNDMYCRVVSLVHPGSGFPPAKLEKMFEEVC